MPSHERFAWMPSPNVEMIGKNSAGRAQTNPPHPALSRKGRGCFRARHLLLRRERLQCRGCTELELHATDCRQTSMRARFATAESLVHGLGSTCSDLPADCFDCSLRDGELHATDCRQTAMRARFATAEPLVHGLGSPCSNLSADCNEYALRDGSVAGARSWSSTLRIAWRLR